MSAKGPTIEQFQIILSVLPPSAALVTTFRAGLRIHNKNWGWDDTFAVLAMLVGLLETASGWIYTFDYEDPTRTPRRVGYWLAAHSYVGAVWLARLSILFSIKRISPLTPRMRNLFFAGIAFIAFSWIFLALQLTLTCRRPESWLLAGPLPTCKLNHPAGIAQIVFETIMDIALVVAPLMLLRDVKLPRMTRIRLFAVFSTSLLTSAAALAHGVLLVMVGGLEEAIGAVVEVAVAVIVCNLAVIVPAMIRAFNSLSGASSREKGGRHVTATEIVFGTQPRYSNGISTTAQSTTPAVTTETEIQDDVGQKLWKARQVTDLELAIELDAVKVDECKATSIN